MSWWNFYRVGGSHSGILSDGTKGQQLHSCIWLKNRFGLVYRSIVIPDMGMKVLISFITYIYIYYSTDHILVLVHGLTSTN